MEIKRNDAKVSQIRRLGATHGRAVAEGAAWIAAAGGAAARVRMGGDEFGQNNGLAHEVITSAVGEPAPICDVGGHLTSVSDAVKP